ncbi:glutamine-hydrolyzing GMP synthase [Salinisphaera sp. USBA-960]|uniref:glutamine-hydrolyzing GMP synthase n=1 Tax=Salinisphaera orenii TaxID=856731 RepID=UPI000DBE346C|nr:glutamine-hydrolyzing GMP synthase [Salifodinibacter halophilus]NNC25781.1 glutamine-hydrolyzing GMP synthase [Salifodinibacter halophilus]
MSTNADARAADAPTPDIHDEAILIVDFGSQYTQLIARRVREAGVYSEIVPCDIDPERVRAFAPRGVILSGGPESVAGESGPRAPAVVFELGVPVLGICYGMQVVASAFGGRVAASATREFGYARVENLDAGGLLAGLSDDQSDHESCETSQLDVWMSHGDKVDQLPPGFTAIARTPHAPLAAMADIERGIYGLQFHPEVTHTEQGQAIVERFVLGICGCHGLWQSDAIADDLVARIADQIGDGGVLLALSGGVDSAVTAALVHRAVGDRLTCVFVDNGLLRENEGDAVMAAFGDHFGIDVRRVDAGERFMTALVGVDDPEAKRRIIGNTFIEVFEEEAGRLTNVAWLAQGTIYPDVVESAGAATGKADLIKSHHNVGGLPAEMNLGLVEPLRELFKDEVRALGHTLGLPGSMLNRHPFPGPGLGVRILGEVNASYAARLRRADAIFIEELVAAEWYDRVDQAFAVFLPVSSVGVMGDGRRYEPVVALRAVQTVDFMTARWAWLPFELIDRVSSRIVNEVDGISRVVYDVTGKPPGTIEWE